MSPLCVCSLRRVRSRAMTPVANAVAAPPGPRATESASSIGLTSGLRQALLLPLSALAVARHRSTRHIRPEFVGRVHTLRAHCHFHGTPIAVTRSTGLFAAVIESSDLQPHLTIDMCRWLPPLNGNEIVWCHCQSRRYVDDVRRHQPAMSPGHKPDGRWRRRLRVSMLRFGALPAAANIDGGDGGSGQCVAVSPGAVQRVLASELACDVTSQPVGRSRASTSAMRPSSSYGEDSSPTFMAARDGTG